MKVKFIPYGLYEKCIDVVSDFIESGGIAAYYTNYMTYEKQIVSAWAAVDLAFSDRSTIFFEKQGNKYKICVNVDTDEVSMKIED